MLYNNHVSPRRQDTDDEMELFVFSNYVDGRAAKSTGFLNSWKILLTIGGVIIAIALVLIVIFIIGNLLLLFLNIFDQIYFFFHETVPVASRNMGEDYGTTVTVFTASQVLEDKEFDSA